MSKKSIRKREKGDMWIWATGSMVTLALLMVVVLMGVILINGLGYFWPKALVEVTLTDDSKLIGELKSRETTERDGKDTESIKLKIGNRDMYGLDFRWVESNSVAETIEPKGLVALERMEHGNFFGRLKEVRAREELVWQSTEPFARLRQLQEALESEVDEVESLKDIMVSKSRKLGGPSARFVEASAPQSREEFRPHC